MTSVFSWHPLAFSGYSLTKGVEHDFEVPVTGTFSFPFANFYSEGKCLLVIFSIFLIFGEGVEHSSGVPVTSSSSLSIANSHRDVKYFLVVLFYLLPLTDLIKKLQFQVFHEPLLLLCHGQPFSWLRWRFQKISMLHKPTVCSVFVSLLYG